MQQFIEFIGRHWQLAALFAVLITLVILNELREHLAGIKRLKCQEVTNFINHQDAIIVDLRSTNDFTQGHILGAINIPSAELSNKMEQLTAHKERPVILVCNLGQTAGGIGQQLQKQGFSQVFCLQGGIASWRNDNLPLVKGK